MTDLPRDQARKLLFNARSIALANQAKELFDQAAALDGFTPAAGDVPVLEEMLRANQASLQSIANEIDTELEAIDAEKKTVEAAFEPFVNASIKAGEALQGAIGRARQQ